MFIEDEKFKEMENTLKEVKEEIQRKHNETFALIDAIESAFKEERESIEEYTCHIDTDYFLECEEEVIRELQNDAIDSLKDRLFGKIDKIRQEYKNANTANQKEMV